MRRFEGLHQRHDKGDAQEESHRRYTVNNTNDNDTLTLAICFADQVRPAHREYDTLPHQQRQAQSRLLALRHIRLGRRRRRVPTGDTIETPAHDTAHNARTQDLVRIVRGGRRDARRAPAPATARCIRARRGTIDATATQDDRPTDARIPNAALGSHAGARYLL